MDNSREIGIIVRGGIGDYLSFTTYYDAIKEKYPNHKKKILHYQVGAFKGLSGIVKDLFQDLDPGMSEYVYINARPSRKYWDNSIVSELIPTVFNLDKTDRYYTFINGRPSENLRRTNIKLNYGSRPKHTLSDEKKNIIIHRYSGVSYKNPQEWAMPQSFWNDVEKRLVDAGNNVIVVGGPDDSLGENTPGVKYLQGKITVRDCATLIKHADGYFGQATWSAIPASENCDKVMIYHPNNPEPFGPNSAQNLFVCFHLNIDRIYFLPISAVNAGIVTRWFGAHNNFDNIVPYGLHDFNSRKRPPKLQYSTKRRKHVIESIDCNDKTTVHVCKKYGGMGDHFFLNYTWNLLKQKRITGRKNYLVTDKSSVPFAKDAGFDKIYTLDEITSIDEKLLFDDAPVLNEVRKRFQGAAIKNVFYETDNIERKELVDYNRIRSDRPTIWNRNIGFDETSLTHTYKISNSERNDARKIVNAIFPITNARRRKPIIGLAPVGTTKQDRIRNYEMLCEKLRSIGYNIIVLHNEPLKIAGTRSLQGINNKRLLPAIAEQLRCIVTVDSGWLCIGALTNVPTVAIMNWGAGRLICKYSDMVEPLYPKKFHLASCPCRRLGLHDNCMMNKDDAKCSDIEINRIVAAVRSATYSPNVIKNTNVGLIGSDSDLILESSNRIAKIHKKKIDLIITNPDPNIRKKIRKDTNASSNIVNVIDIPTVDGTSNDKRIPETLAIRRNHIYYDAAYIDMELPVSGG